MARPAPDRAPERTRATTTVRPADRTRAQDADGDDAEVALVGNAHMPGLAGIPAGPGDAAVTGLEAQADADAEELARDGPSVDLARVHTGPAADRAADALDAEAFTVDGRIHVGADAPPLSSPQGRLLLAHELVHVRQQARGDAPPGVPLTKRRSGSKGRKGKPFRVRVETEMGSDELLREFVRQYYRLTDERQVNRLVSGWTWTGRPRAVGRQDAARKYVDLPVRDESLTGFATLAPRDQQAANAETDRRFAEQYQLPPDFRIGPGDEEMAARWRGVRANLLAEQEQARTLRALPEDIQKILFAGGRQITPDEYDRALAVAAELGELSPAERARYRATVNSGTDDLDEFARSVAAFHRESRMRDLETERTEAAAAPLFGMEELYDLYMAKRTAEQRTWTAPLAAGAVGVVFPPAAGVGAVGSVVAVPWSRRERAAATAKFRDALSRSRFRTEAEFESAIAAYRDRFRADAVRFALDVLAGYDNQLYQATLRYRDEDAAEPLVAAIARSGARADYDAGDRKAALAEMAARTENVVAERTGGPVGIGDDSGMLQAEADELYAAGGRKVAAAAPDEQLVQLTGLGTETDRALLARATVPEARAHLLTMIEARRADTAQARAELSNNRDPERIYTLPGLVDAALQAHGITADTIYGRIVRDRRKEIRNEQIFSSIVQVVVALALAALVPVGGWVAAAALIGSAGLSVHQAVEAIQEYRNQARAHRLGFLEEHPSLLWVGLAVVAAAVDLGSVAKVFQTSATGLKLLEDPLVAVAEAAKAGDQVATVSRLVELQERIATVSGLHDELRNALAARAAAETGLNRALASTMTINGFAGAVDPRPLFKALYYVVKKGTTKVSALRSEKRLIDALGDITRMSAGSLDELTEAFGRVNEVVRVGAAKNMDEETVLRFVDRLAAERAGGEGAFEGVVAEMRRWRPPTAEQKAAQGALDTAHKDLVDLRTLLAETRAEQAAVRRKEIPGSCERMDELEETRLWLEGGNHPITGKNLGPGAITDAQREFHEAMRLAELAGLDPKVAMRSAFAVSPERAAVLKSAGGVDRVGGLRVPPYKEVHPDHVVSLQRMLGIHGFEKLNLAERRLLAVRADNLIAMDGAANLSKGERAWSAWPQASHFYPPETIQKMIQMENRLYATISDWIATATKGRP